MQTFDRRWGFGSYPGSWTPPARDRRGRRLTVSAFLCAGVGLVVLPILLGPMGLGLGVAAALRGDPLGRWAAMAGAAALCVGTFLGALLIAGR
ncbi:MAG TPA: hypothetical protein VGI06_01825 [Acidimicrobiales bacterium]